MGLDFRRPKYPFGFLWGEALIWAINRGGGGGGIPTFISGIPPLVLRNALAKALESLVQYGKVEQSQTPTPTSPVNITCNNGTLMWKDRELPVGYTRIERITFGGSTYYETNEKLYGSDVVTITIDNFVSSGQNLFGAYSGTSSSDINFSLYIYGSATGQAYWRYGTTLYRPIVGGTSLRTLTFGAGGTTGFKTNVSYSTVEFETTDTARIGALPNSSVAKFEGDIVGNITVGNRLRYIPCIRQSDGTIGYYELMNQTFLEPQGSAPTAGAADITHMALEVVGTPEEISIIQNLVGEIITKKAVRAGGVSEANPLGSEMDNNAWSCTDYIAVDPNTEYTTIVPRYSGASAAGLVFFSGTTVESAISGVATVQQGSTTYTFITPSNCHYLRFSWSNSDGNDVKMFAGHLPQTASAVNLFGTDEYQDTQDIITGEVVRKIGIKVFNGMESYSAMNYGYATDELSDFPNENFMPFCTHFVGKTTASAAPDTIRLYFTSGGVPRTYFFVDQTVDDFSTVDKFKAWLAAQYAAGTPVIVLYPLAEPITELTTPQPLSTIEGDNTLTVTAEVDNIKFDITYQMKQS